jgi:creatinine amidohydrolase
MAFPGTVTIRPETLEAYLGDCCRSLASHGFKAILIFSGHGGNHPPLAAIAPRLEREVGDARLIVYANLIAFFDGLMASADRQGISAAVAGGHAGELETSMILSIRPELVDRRAFESGYLGPLGDVQDRVLREGLATITPNGIMGDPRSADGCRGERYLADYADQIAGFFREKLGETSGVKTKP